MDSKESILYQIDNQRKVIVKALDYYLKGLTRECHEIIYDNFFNASTTLKNIYYKEIPAGGPVYRLRSIHGNQTNLNTSDLFHIPFEKNYLLQNQRYSMSGVPCLYLGNSAYVCWQELSKPCIDNCYFSVFRLEQNLRLVDLVPVEIKSPKELLRYALAIACSIKYSEQDAAFKNEYIVPQAVLSSMNRYNSFDVQRNPALLKFDGILYLSSRIAAQSHYSDLDLMFNYVLPAKTLEDAGLCSELKMKFTVSDPKSVQDLIQILPQMGPQLNINELDDEHAYEDSPFEFIEKYIKGPCVKKGFII